MDIKHGKLLRILLLATLALVSCAITDKEWGRLSKEEDLEFDMRLKAINKPAIKSFKTKYGDIFDCVDIYKQLAFDHPLLKNHRIQMQPQNILSKMIVKNSIKNISFDAKLEMIDCPQGSVPIKRATKEDLLIDKYTRPHHPTNYTQSTVEDGNRRIHMALFEYANLNYGASARLNVWNPPNVPPHQRSSSHIWIVNVNETHLNTVQAGWTAFPSIYKDTKTRTYAFWQGNLIHGTKTNGCFNLLCPGFIQVNQKLPLDSRLNRDSIYGGNQFELKVQVYQNAKTKDWWLYFDDQPIGYWPRNLFSMLEDGGNHVTLGGHVVTRTNEQSASMGSGHFPNEGYRRAAYIRDIVIDIPFSKINPKLTQLISSNKQCYDVKSYKDNELGDYILFGGPGKCTG